MTTIADSFLNHARKTAQQIAARSPVNVYIVRAKPPQRFQIVTGDEPPARSEVVEAYRPGGQAVPAWEPAHGAAPRACRKTYDVYEKDNPVAPIGTIKGQTRGEAYGLARQAYPGLELVLGIAGPGSRDEIVRILEREEKKAREEEAKQARRNGRLAKEAERERLAKGRQHYTRIKAERDAKEARIAAEDERRRPLGLPTGHDPAEPIAPDWQPVPVQDTAAFIAASRAATDAAIKAELARIDEEAEEEDAPARPGKAKPIGPAESQKTMDAFPIQPGMIVQTSYGTGPYRVESLHRNTSVYCGSCGRSHTVAQTLIDMTVTRPGEPGKKTFYYLNGFHLRADGRIVARESPCVHPDPARPAPDEITIVDDDQAEDRGWTGPLDQMMRDIGPEEETHQAEEEDDEPTPARPSWHVYRITDDGRLWVAGQRERRKADPEPTEAGQYRHAHYLGNGRAISWETHRSKAQPFYNRAEAARHTLAQGWNAQEIRVIRSDAEPSIDDEPPTGPADRPAPGRGTPERIAQADAYREERDAGDRPGFPVTSGSAGGGYPLKGAPGPQPQSEIPPAMTDDELRQADPFDMQAAIAENAAIKARAEKAQAGLDARKVRARDPNAPKPYGWDFLATFTDGTQRRIARAGSSENTARKSALRGKGVVALADPDPLTEEQYSRAYGSRKIRM